MKTFEMKASHSSAQTHRPPAKFGKSKWIGILLLDNVRNIVCLLIKSQRYRWGCIGKASFEGSVSNFYCFRRSDLSCRFMPIFSISTRIDLRRKFYSDYRRNLMKIFTILSQYWCPIQSNLFVDPLSCQTHCEIVVRWVKKNQTQLPLWKFLVIRLGNKPTFYNANENICILLMSNALNAIVLGEK